MSRACVGSPRPFFSSSGRDGRARANEGKGVGLGEADDEGLFVQITGGFGF
jgi:hypothetical protein